MNRMETAVRRQETGRISSASGLPSPASDSNMHRKLIAFVLLAPFMASIIGAYAWFNTSIGLRSPASSLRSSGIWLEARTNIVGYTFVPEQVSDSVMKGLGTTNIISGTFYRNPAEGGQRSEVRDQNSAARNRPSELTSDLRPLISGVTSDNRHPTSEQTSDLRFPTSARGLGTTNILSGTFYRNDVNGSQTSEVGSQNSATRNRPSEPTSDLRPLTSGMTSDLRPLISGMTSDIRFPTSRLSPELTSDLGPLTTGSSSPPTSDLRPRTSEQSLDSDRITVFLASWSAESEAPLSVLGHTPDKCWVGTGWKQIELGLKPVMLNLKLSDSFSENESITGYSETHSGLRFDRGVFVHPDGIQREAAAWCALVGGGLVTDLSRPTGSEETLSAFMAKYFQYFEDRLNRFWELIEYRNSERSVKQFVRLSVPVTDDQETAFRTIRVFVPTWLHGSG